MEQTFISYDRMCKYWSEHISSLIMLNSQLDKSKVSLHSFYSLDEFINKCERHYSFSEGNTYYFKDCKIETFKDWYNKQ